MSACLEFPRLLLSQSIKVSSGSASRLYSGERLLSVEWLTLVTALLQSRHDLNSLFELPLTPNCEETGGWLRHRGIYFIPSACTAAETSLRGEQTAPVSCSDLRSHVRAGKLLTSLSKASQTLSIIINYHQRHIIPHNNKIINRTQTNSLLEVLLYFWVPEPYWRCSYDWTVWLMWCSWWLIFKTKWMSLKNFRLFSYQFYIHKSQNDPLISLIVTQSKSYF